jgi:hypothetical protein
MTPLPPNPKPHEAGQQEVEEINCRKREEAKKKSKRRRRRRRRSNGRDKKLGGRRQNSQSTVCSFKANYHSKNLCLNSLGINS